MDGLEHASGQLAAVKAREVRDAHAARPTPHAAVLATGSPSRDAAGAVDEDHHCHIQARQARVCHGLQQWQAVSLYLAVLSPSRACALSSASGRDWRKARPGQAHIHAGGDDEKIIAACALFESVSGSYEFIFDDSKAMPAIVFAQCWCDASCSGGRHAAQVAGNSWSEKGAEKRLG
ncbi:hypothetical protein [Comamonas thiooxydans]|uniref:hypothetical protein n=1 Tax=Comamonas thiooxydans TaxID=363952 RepID=UPI001CCE8743|nr:hypothetical protein [Comamonas thiooxydans]UBQ40936.1 hypothetical protein LCH15_19765 [Comamonas thiooxydans]